MPGTQMRFPPLNVLTEKECRDIHETTQYILDHVGVHVPHEQARSILHSAGARVGPENRVYVPESVLQAALQAAPERVILTGLDPSRQVIIGGGHVNFLAGAGLLYVLETDGTRRRATLQDLADFTRLGDALEYLDVNHGMFDPVDVQGKGLYPMAASRIISNTTKPTALVIDGKKDVQAIAEMAIVALGSETAIRERPFLTLHDSTALSPLRHDPKNCDVILEACRWGLPTGLVAWPMLGVSSPVTLAGAMAQRNATALTGLVLAQTANPGNPFLIQMSLGGVDMRTGNAFTAGPEIALAHLVGAQMARYYNLPCVAITATDAKIADAQAGAEKSFHLTIAALAGINLIHGSTGEMDTMMISSAAQCVIDNDVMGMVRRLISGVQVDRENLAVDVIHDVALGDGNYLVHPHTLSHFRQIFTPHVFTRQRQSEWLDSGARSASDVAAQRATHILDHHFPSPLDREQVREIERIARSYDQSQK